MSNVERDPAELRCGPVASADHDGELLRPREVPLGGPRAIMVGRTLPNRDRRMVGAWCFVDFYGPTDITGQAGMQVPPHPHTGLQTVSWLLDGEVLHRDSLGHEQLVRPGELNLMTAANGIAHSEESPADHSAVLHGLQLWIALPAEMRAVEPSFDHHGDLPVVPTPNGEITVIMGELLGAVSPARTYTPLLGAQVSVPDGSRLPVPVREDFEHAVLALTGDLPVEGHTLARGEMIYLAPGRSRLDIGAGRALLLGGVPFEEQIVMWWNFVGRTHEEVAGARAEWERQRQEASGGRFGVVHGYAGAALAAPELPHVALRARGRSRHE